jgi:hypothetical protein
MRMAIFTKEFANADEYEEWLQEVGERITVMSITNAPEMHGSTIQWTTGPITVKYETSDPSLAPSKSMAIMIVQMVIIGALFFALFIYLVSRI